MATNFNSDRVAHRLRKPHRTQEQIIVRRLFLIVIAVSIVLGFLDGTDAIATLTGEWSR
jgi:hypothetical protein